MARVQAHSPLVRLPTITLGLVIVVGCSTPQAAGRPVQVLVPPGAGLRAITDTLVHHGVIVNPFWFRTLARMTRADRSMQTGRYEFGTPTPARDVLRALQRGDRLLTKLTIPEGLSLHQLSRLLEGRLGIPRDTLLRCARDTTMLRRLGFSTSGAEGYLWPETYHIDSTESPKQLVEIFLRGFVDHWDSAWTDQLDSVGLTRHGVVTLASIVEGEAQVDDERPIIAAVYLNRLRLGMPLQADPTVQYAIEQRTGERKTRLYEKDYQVVSPFNTYLYAGLPPGPIGSPGQKSIEAVLFPDDVPYLYFVADSNGRHRFSTSYRDHLRAIARVRSRR